MSSHTFLLMEWLVCPTSQDVYFSGATITGQQRTNPAPELRIRLVIHTFECADDLSLALTRRTVTERVEDSGTHIGIRIMDHRDQSIPYGLDIRLDMTGT